MASMDLVIDRTSAHPPFAQVRDRIERAIRSGELAAGSRLPPVRTLAAGLEIAPGTVARAYRELELHGLVDTRGRHGTFVAVPGAQRTVNRRVLAEQATAYARTAARFGVPPGEAVELVELALRGSSPAD